MVFIHIWEVLQKPPFQKENESMMSTTQRVLSAIAAIVLVATTALAAAPNRSSFAEFDARAKAGERLNVVFFGASLTWGANATDQARTSYRARVTDMLEARYPKARFKTYDAAIGGTGSQLGVFRLERDVLSRQPDLVFLDFSANDDNRQGSSEVFASYESLIRRIILEAKAPVVPVMFPFQWEQAPAVKSGKTDHLGGLQQRKVIAAAYHAPVGDAVELITQRVKAGQATLAQIWDTDGVHPGDFGYRLFAEAAFAAFEEGVKSEATCVVQEKMLHADTYMTNSRVRLADLPALPEGWSKGRPNLTAVNYDWLMSRWLDDLVVAGNRKLDEKGKPGKESQPVQPLRLNVEATAILLFGECTTDSGKFRVKLDGKPVTGVSGWQEKGSDLFDGNRWKNGNGFLLIEIARGLDPATPHLLEIEPVFDDAKAQELKIESICVAGGKATVTLAQ
jgi:lysophospholipase L1-like esterase